MIPYYFLDNHMTIEDVQVKDLFNNLPDSVNLFNQLSDTVIESFEYYGATLAEWADRMQVVIPKEIDLMIIRDLLIQVGNKLQAASVYYSLCSSYNSFLSSSLDDAKNHVINDLVADYLTRNAKRPAVGVLNNIADSKFAQPLTQVLISRILKDFWKERRDMLIETRKILEQLNLSQTMELKYTQIE